MSSSLLDNNKNLSTEKEQLTGLESQAKIPTINATKKADCFYLPEGLLNMVKEELRIMISAVVDQMKSEGTPLPHQTTEKNQENALTVVAPASALKVSKAKNKLIGEISVNFQPPENSLVNYINLDKIQSGKKKGKISNSRLVEQLTFEKRLEGWIIQRRERPNQKQHDTSYRHIASRKSFRSISEVISFLMYKICPVYKNPRRTPLIIKNLAKKRASSSTASKRRRKQSSNVASSSGKKSEIEIVEEEILGNDELDKFIEEMADKLSKYPFDVKEKLKIHDGEEPGARINRLMDETIEITRFLSGSGSIPEMKEDDKGKTSLTFASFSSPMMKGDNIIEEQTEALQNDNPMMKEKEEITDEQIEMLLNDGDRLSSLLRSLEDIMDTEDSNEEVSSKFL